MNDTAADSSSTDQTSTDFAGVDRHAPEPIYEQIKRAISDRIQRGDWRAGVKLPSENDLVATLGVSRMTINRALRELAQQGVIRRVHGVGSFVAQPPRHASLIEVKDIALEVAADGGQHRCEVITLETRAADASVAARLALAPDEPVYYLEAVHFGDGQPILHESRYVRRDYATAFIDQDFTAITSTAWLLRLGQPDEIEHIVTAVNPSPALRERLQVDHHEPCLQLSRRTWTHGRVVTWATLTHPGSRYDLAARYSTRDYLIR
jgi:GntR family histidine utilization transcriptional repressor